MPTSRSPQNWHRLCRARLCDNNIDAFAYTVGHPAGAREATTTCDSVIVPVEGEAVDKLVADHPYYFRRRSPRHISRYRQRREHVRRRRDVRDLRQVSDEAVYTVVKAIFDNFDDFKLHPALANLQPESMVNQATQPLHRCREVLQEKGWLK